MPVIGPADRRVAFQDQINALFELTPGFAAGQRCRRLSTSLAPGVDPPAACIERAPPSDMTADLVIPQPEPAGVALALPDRVCAAPLDAQSFAPPVSVDPVRQA